MSAGLENSAVVTGLGKVSYLSSSKERQCQRMLKLYNYTHFIRWQSNAQNTPSQASVVHELRTSRYSSWIQRRQRNQRSNCQHRLGSQKKQQISRKTFTSASLTMLKPLTLWITTSCGKFLKRWEYQTTLPAHEKPVCRSRSSSLNQKWNKQLVPNWKRSRSRLYIVTWLV